MRADAAAPRLLLALAGLVASLLVVTAPAPPAAAVGSCRGLVATHTGTEGNDTISGTDGRDVIAALGGHDTVFGFAGDDVICLGDGNDVAYGLEGRNEFVPGLGNDYVYGNGETDADLVVYEDIQASVGVDLPLGRAGSGAGDDRLHAIGSVVGSWYSDTIIGDWNANTLSGNLGSDFIVGGGGPDHLRGGHGDDTLQGDAGDDLLEGMAHRDTLRGGLGDDVLDGSQAGAGRSREGDVVTYSWSSSAVTVDLSNGKASGEGADVLMHITDAHGSVHDDRLVGDGTANRLEGDGGADLLLPGLGDDDLDGGGGSDTVSFLTSGGPVTASLHEGTAHGSGEDMIAGVERLVGSPYGDRLVGSAGVDVLRGGDGDDLLRGLPGKDTLVGDAGDDRLDGGPDADLCNGGGGTDLGLLCETEAYIP